jgi:hypothetical protein
MKLKLLTSSPVFQNHIFSVVLIFISSLILSACQTTATSTPVTSQPGTFPVSPLLIEYYQDKGGENLLGPVISALIDQDGLKCQYTVAVLMCLDPEATGTARFRLAPLGIKIGIHEAPPLSSPPDGAQVVGGYPIYPGFAKPIETLNGIATVGKPLTSVRYNYEQQRVEQYFENAAFYYRFDDPTGKVSLLPYGWYYCGRSCHYELSETRMFNPIKVPLDTPFAPGLEQIGGLKVFGQPLTQPYIAQDGNLEQVYENVVVYGPKETPVNIHLRPLARKLGMVTADPGPKKFGVDQNVIFYKTTGDLGYHVPMVFDSFLSQHGGKAISGNPIADPIFYEKDVPRQCFETYCLDFHPQAAEVLRVRMVPLGVEYLQKFAPASAVPTSLPQTKLTLSASEQAPQITAQEKQIINVTATQLDAVTPAAGVVTQVTLTLPDATQVTLTINPTDAQGRSSVTVPAMPSLANGSMVTYQVCVADPGSTVPCVSKSYLIWNQK